MVCGFLICVGIYGNNNPYGLSETKRSISKKEKIKGNEPDEYRVLSLRFLVSLV